MSAVTSIPFGEYVIRLGTQIDIPTLGPVETSAGSTFHSVSLSPLADDAPMPVEKLSDICRAGNLKVAALGSTDEVVAFLAGELIVVNSTKATDPEAKLEEENNIAMRTYFHIAELSTHARHQRRGLGAALLQSAISDCRDRGVAGLTLTTYRDVPFNGPFYRKFGFQEVDPKSVGVDFENNVLEELQTIYEPSRRCFMLLML